MPEPETPTPSKTVTWYSGFPWAPNELRPEVGMVFENADGSEETYVVTEVREGLTERPAD